MTPLAQVALFSSPWANVANPFVEMRWIASPGHRSYYTLSGDTIYGAFLCSIQGGWLLATHGVAHHQSSALTTTIPLLSGSNRDLGLL